MMKLQVSQNLRMTNTLPIFRSFLGILDITNEIIDKGVESKCN